MEPRTKPTVTRRLRNWWLPKEQQYYEWAVKYPGKREELFSLNWVAIDFAVHVYRDPRLMKDLIDGRLTGTSETLPANSEAV